jgi:hypothetical protein
MLIIPYTPVNTYADAKLLYVVHCIIWARIKKGFYASLTKENLRPCYWRLLESHTILLKFCESFFQPDSLQFHCCVVILKNLRDDRDFSALPLPLSLKNLLCSIAPSYANYAPSKTEIGYAYIGDVCISPTLL